MTQHAALVCAVALFKHQFVTIKNLAGTVSVDR